MPALPKVYGHLLWLESGWKVAGKWLATFLDALNP
jgi:hypothetical protein